MRSLPRARRKSGYRAESPKCQLSLVLRVQHNRRYEIRKFCVANFPFRNVYYVVRSAKQKKDNNLVVWIATEEPSKRLNYVLFHISVGRTLKLASLAKPAKMQSRVNFPDFSSLSFSNSKSDTA